MDSDILLRKVRPFGAESTDMLVRDGRIARIGASLAVEPGVTEEACEGAIALPGLVEAHTHLDKSLWGMGWREHQAGPGLRDKIDNERRLRREWDIDPYRQSMRQALLSLSHGSTAIRSHVDVDTECGLAGGETGVQRATTAGKTACGRNQPRRRPRQPLTVLGGDVA